MAGTQNSISSLIAQFMRLQKNSLEILNGLNEAAVSTNSTVTIEVLDEAGLPKNANIPSYGYLRGEIQRLDNNIKALAGIGNNFATVRNPDGTYSQIYKVETLKDPPTLSNLPVPRTFYVKDNWFFESFLSPLLYININVTGKIPDAEDRIKVKRIIANTDTIEKQNFFDTSLKGRNDFTHDQFITSITNAGIDYFVDEDVISLPLRTIRFVGGFSAISYYDDVVILTDANGKSFKETRRNYKLNTLKYTDTLSNVKNGRTLNVNDTVSTPGGTLYLITSIDKSQASIQAKRVSGYDPIALGSNTLSISSTDFGPRYIQVNIGYNERQGVFFKTIDDNFNIIGSNWSTGIIFWSNDLETKNSNGEIVSLETYYLEDVSDLGKMLLGMSKEKKIPAVQGIVPDVPLVTASNFKVVQINKQVTDSTSAKTINEKLQAKSVLKSEINSLDDAINKVKLQLNTGLATSDQTTFQLNTENNDVNSILGANLTQSQVGQVKNPIGVNVNSLRANLNSLIEERVKKVQLYASIVNEVSTLTQDVPQILESPKYHVRGFWPIPAPKSTAETGDQTVIQFSVRYRYLSDSGASQPSETIEYLDTDGVMKSGSFSNWIEYKTDIRKKEYNASKGFYIWAPEITSDANAQNINQLDLAITKGEKIEIQISSISEAGWPDNPLTSDYSSPVTVVFPDNLSVSGVSNIIKTNNEDSAVVKVQTDLAAQGLPLHLSEQFTSGDKAYFHNSSGIASGFYTNTGAVINLLEKLTDLQNQINLIKSSLSSAKGTLEVYIVDSSGNKIKVSRGSTIKLNAGFTSDIFTGPLSTDAGKIASVSYSIQLYNSQASPVELSSSIPGGLETRAPISVDSTYPSGYNSNLRYSDMPISVTSETRADLITNGRNNTFFRQPPPFASSSSYSQFIYPRYKSVGFDQILVNNPSTVVTPNLSNYFTSIYTSSYAYNGVVSSSAIQSNFGIQGVYPQNGTILVPYDPDNIPVEAVGGTASNVWNGQFTGVSAGSPLGGGFLSEFGIDRRHPYLVSIGDQSAYTVYSDLVKPYLNPFTYAPFRHTQCFWGDTSLSQYWVQSSFRTPLAFPTDSTTAREDNMYPDKLGFISNDEYLIGKFSCGAYLFLAPSLGSFLQVPGTTSLSITNLLDGDTNAINIPLVFQFRTVDKSGYIGGWRKAGNLTNITYTKKIGIDIQVLNSDIFSFDVQVTGSYKNNTLVAPNFNSERT